MMQHVSLPDGLWLPALLVFVFATTYGQAFTTPLTPVVAQIFKQPNLKQVQQQRSTDSVPVERPGQGKQLSEQQQQQGGPLSSWLDSPFPVMRSRFADLFEQLEREFFQDEDMDTQGSAFPMVSPLLRGDSLLPQLGAGLPSARLDISETKDKWIAKVDLPGVDKKDVKLTLDNGMLTISAERKQKTEDADETFHRVESSYGRITRTIGVPEYVDPSKVQTEFNNGLLRITIPKVAEQQQSRGKAINIA